MSGKLPKLNSERIKKNFDLPNDYVITKFYELGYKVSYNKYNNTYISCCPLCKEGKSWGRKKRCFYIPENDNIFCHNCGISLKPYNWIRKVSGMGDEELRRDMESSNYSIEIPLEVEKPIKILPSLPEDSINLFDKMQMDYYHNDEIVKTALNYIKTRKLDVAINRPDALFISKKDFSHKNRLILPFKDSNGKIVFYQSRKLFEWDDKPTYLSKFGADKSLFGMDRINSEKEYVFLFEGPIDSCFVKNSIAVGGINEGQHRFTPTQNDQLEELKFFKKIWVLDSQWIDRASREKTKVLLEMGECVFIWPKKWGHYKDFNDICISKDIPGISSNFIREHSFCGKSSLLKYKILFGSIK